MQRAGNANQELQSRQRILCNIYSSRAQELQVAWRVGTVVFSRIVITVAKQYKFEGRVKALHVRMFKILAYLGLQILFIRDRGRGGAGRAAAPPLFAPPPPLLALKRKIAKIKKDLKQFFFRLYSAIFSVFSLISNARHFVGLLCFSR